MVRLNISDAQATSFAPLYEICGGQSKPLTAYLQIEPATGECNYGVNRELDNALPPAVRRGDLIWISVPPTLWGEMLVNLFDAVRPQVEAVCSAWAARGRIGEAADILEQVIARESSCVTIEPAAAWLEEEREMDIYADTGDEEIEELAKSYYATARDFLVYLDGDVRSLLKSWRDEEIAAEKSA